MVVDFAKRMNLAIVNTYFKKKDEHRVTYKSGDKSTQVDYVTCRRKNLKEMCNCKVIVNDVSQSSTVWWYAKWLLWSSSSSFEGYPLQVRHKQDWGQGFILLLPQTAALPGSDAGSDVIKPASSFVIQNRQTACSMWCPMYRARC